MAKVRKMQYAQKGPALKLLIEQNEGLTQGQLISKFKRVYGNTISPSFVSIVYRKTKNSSLKPTIDKISEVANLAKKIGSYEDLVTLLYSVNRLGGTHKILEVIRTLKTLKDTI